MILSGIICPLSRCGRSIVQWGKPFPRPMLAACRPPDQPLVCSSRNLAYRMAMPLPLDLRRKHRSTYPPDGGARSCCSGEAWGKLRLRTAQKLKRHSPKYCLGAGADLQLQKDMFGVRLDCLRRDLKSPSDAFIGAALADHREDVAFPRSERIADAAAGLRGAAGFQRKVEVRGLLTLASLFLKSKRKLSNGCH